MQNLGKASPTETVRQIFFADVDPPTEQVLGLCWSAVYPYIGRNLQVSGFNFKLPYG